MVLKVYDIKKEPIKCFALYWLFLFDLLGKADELRKIDTPYLWSRRQSIDFKQFIVSFIRKTNIKF